MSNTVDNNVSTNSMKDILNRMSLGKECDYPVMANPFNEPGFLEKSKINEEEMMNIHKDIKSSARLSLYESLGDQLRQDSGYGDYESVLDATKRSDFLEFCNLKDDNGFAAIKWAGDMGYHKIVKLLLDSGAEPDKAGLKDFINIKFDENDLESFKEMDTIRECDENEDSYNDSFGNFHPDLNIKDLDLRTGQTEQSLPRTKKEKKEMIKRVVDFEESFREKQNKFPFSSKFSEKEYNGADMSDDIVEDGEELPDGRTDINTPIVTDKMFENAIPYNPPQKPVKKTESGGFGKAFAKNLAKNFSKTGFSNDRYDKFVPPGRKEFTADEIQQMMNSKGVETFQGKSNEFLEEFSSKDVTKYLMTPAKIQPMLRIHRLNMCAASPVRDDLYNSVKNSFKHQKKVLKTSIINKITDSIYEMIKFYLDMYHRLMDFGRVEVRNSPIHGKGIFATRKIKRGDVVTFYFPYFLNYSYSENEKEPDIDICVPIISRRRFDKEGDDKKYNELFASTIKIPGNFYLMGDDEYISDSRLLGHMVNDPCDFSKGKPDHIKYEKELLQKANASVVSYKDDRRYVYIGAMRDIEIGEEILVPYGGRYWEIESPKSETV